MQAVKYGYKIKTVRNTFQEIKVVQYERKNKKRKQKRKSSPNNGRQTG